MNIPPLREVARLGTVHHMLFGRCTRDPDFHAETLHRLIAWPELDTFDCCLPFGEERQRELSRAIRACGKVNITFAPHLFPGRKLSFSSPDYAEQEQCRLLAKYFIDQAAAIGARYFIFFSGGPSWEDGTPEHRRAFRDFCRWLCRSLAPHGITALLEPFDFTVDKKFLYGPLDECIALLEEIGAEHENIGMELDIAHLPLMGEDIASSIHRARRWIQRVHLGNCCMKPVSDPFYGDNHPPIGYVNGEIDTPQIALALRALADIGYLNHATKGDLVIELQPFPGRSEEDSLRDNLQRVEDAWRLQASTSQHTGPTP